MEVQINREIIVHQIMHVRICGSLLVQKNPIEANLSLVTTTDELLVENRQKPNRDKSPWLKIEEIMLAIIIRHWWKHA